MGGGGQMSKQANFCHSMYLMKFALSLGLDSCVAHTQHCDEHKRPRSAQKDIHFIYRFNDHKLPKVILSYEHENVP